MSMGGKGPEVLVTLTTDFGKILEGIHRTKIKGTTHFATGIQIAGVSLFTVRFVCWAREYLAHGNCPCVASFKAPTKQVSTATDHSVLLLTHHRGREDSGQTSQEDEEE